MIRAAATPSAAGLVLRPWARGDAGVLVEAYRDPAMRHWETRHVDTAEDAERWLEEQRLGWERGDRLGFAVREGAYEGLGEGGAYAGPRDGGAYEGPPVAHVVLKRTGGGSGPGSGSGSGSAQVGYWTAAPARGRGVASRALAAVTAWAFEAFAADGLERIELLRQVDNLASCRVAERSGFAFDRILPATPPFPLDGHLHVRLAPHRPVPRAGAAQR